MTNPRHARARPLAKVISPGMHAMSPEDYHADRTAISSSGARLLLPPDGSPARFRYDMDHPRRWTKDLDLGQAAHMLVLGVGPEIVEIDAMDYRTKAAQTARDGAHNQGQIPLLPDQIDTVYAMADTLRAHPVANRLLLPGSGQPEQALFWHDQRLLGEQQLLVLRRCLLDWYSPTLREERHGRLLVPDYKTCRSAAPEKFAKAVFQYGLHQQAAWNLDGIRALLGEEDPVFLFIAQEKKPPYIVSVIELNHEALMWGNELNVHALNVYRKCVTEDRWPGYSDEIVQIGLPPYAERMHAESVEFMKEWVESPDGILPLPV